MAASAAWNPALVQQLLVNPHYLPSVHRYIQWYAKSRGVGIRFYHDSVTSPVGHMVFNYDKR